MSSCMSLTLSYISDISAPATKNMDLLICLASPGLPLELGMVSLLPQQHAERRVDSQGKFRGYWMLTSK